MADVPHLACLDEDEDEGAENEGGDKE